MPDYDVFLSYSRQDLLAMRYLRRPLELGRLRVFVDESGIPPGARWGNELARAIENSCCLVVLLSPDAANSDWVREEIDYARRRGKQIFGVWIRGDFNAAVPFGLTTTQLIDLTTGNEAGISSLIEQIRNLCAPLTPVTRPMLPTQPIDPHTLSQLINYLKAAARLTQADKSVPEGRACLFWVDSNRQELYIIGATEDVNHEELTLRFKPGEGFMGQVWQLDKFQIANVAVLLAQGDSMSAGLRRITEKLKSIVGIPIHEGEPGSRIIGILSIDSILNTVRELRLDDEANVRRIVAEVQEIIRLIKDLHLPALPFSYRRHNNLRTILRMARLFMAVEPLRATLYCLDPHQNRMRLALVSSKQDLRESPYLKSSFGRNEGVVGKVWATGQPVVSDRTNLSDEELRRDWNMSLSQIDMMREVKSLVGFPIFNQGTPREVIAVLAVASDLPLAESNLDQYEFEFRWLADSMARWLEPEG